jgi:hypothetical protein
MNPWCDRNLFRSPIYYAAVFTEAEFQAQLTELSVPRDKWPPFLSTPQADATAHYLEKPDGKKCCIVCLRHDPGRDPIEVVGLLVHEAMHLWRWIREYIGEHSPSAEFEAYSMQWISQQLMAEYRDFLKRQAA